MRKTLGKARPRYVLFAFVLAAGTFGLVSQSFAGPTAESAGGHGTLSVVDENGDTVKRQFTFHARKSADGTVTGKVVLRNPAFSGDDGKAFSLKGDISCMQVIGNIAILGGTAETNDANLNDAFYFTVQDNGEPGKDRDRMSSTFFFDGDPDTQGDPQLCLLTGPNDFPLNPIEGGNIQVRGGVQPTP